MDSQKFDGIAKLLASGASRRDVLRKLAGAALGGTLAVAELGRASAAPAGKVGVCHKTSSATNPLVYIEISANAVPAHAAHGDATNVNLQTDVNNCGACGNVCPGDTCNTPVCQNGHCGTTAVICQDDGNECTDVSCVMGTGCVTTSNSEPCDGGSGTCVEGICEPNCEVTCTGNFRLDPDACACFCPVDVIVCPPGEVVELARCICIPEQNFCVVGGACGDQAVCGDPNVDFCGCFDTPEGNNFCIDHGACGQACTSSDTCPEGTQCANTCCGFACQYACGDPRNDISALRGGRTTYSS